MELIIAEMSEEEHACISGILDTVKQQSKSLEVLRVDHSGRALSLKETAQETLQEHYMVS